MIMFVLALAVFLPYVRTVEYDFISYDDTAFVTENAEVLRGLTGEGIAWAFTAFHSGNWVPMAWMSHMLDVSLFGLDAGWHHIVSVIFHTVATVLLFLALFRMTGGVWQSAFVAALFGLHPLHVESVAWIAERRDVLSGFFFMLTLLSYERYVRRGGTGRYLLVIGCFSLGLLSKQMLVTVPFVLLLLDYWPLGRTSLAAAADGSAKEPTPWGRLFREKAPMIALAVAASVLTFAAQKEGGAMTLMERELLPFGARFANAMVSYAAYIGKTIWPSSLTIFYTHPGRTLPWWKVIGSAAVLLTVLIVALRQSRKCPFLVVGWLWYAGMLIPVIGLVQVGMQAMADRYTYLPLIGPFIMLAWSAEDMLSRTGAFRNKVMVLSAGAILVSLAALTTVQAGHWRDTITIFDHAVSVAPDNWVAHRKLGNALADKGLTNEAIAQYRESIRAQPKNSLAHLNLGVELARQGKYEEAIEHYREALRIRPDLAEAYNNLGNALAVTGRRGEAIEQYREALRLRPGWKVVRNNMELLSTERERTRPGTGEMTRKNKP